jgi:hypothetical protein
MYSLEPSHSASDRLASGGRVLPCNILDVMFVKNNVYHLKYRSEEVILINAG